MLYCPKCKIKIRGNKRCCPLCQGRLEGEGEDPAFPTLKKRRVGTLTFFRICAFICIILEIGMFSAFYISGYTLRWTLIVMASVAFALFDLGVSMYFRGNVLKLITVQSYICMIASYIIDIKTGSFGWSWGWMIPISFVLLVITTIIIGNAMHLYIVDYVIYLISDVALSLLQIIPIYKGLNRSPYMAVISMALMLVFASFVFIFRFKDLQSASSKYLNLG